MTKRGRRLTLSAEFLNEDFLSNSKTAKHPNTCIRLLAMHHIQQGDSLKEAADKVCACDRTVQIWLRNYRAEGLSGLENRPGQGRKPLLSESEAQQFKRMFLQAQAQKEGGRLIAKDAAALLAQHFVAHKPAAVYTLLHRLGLSWISGRDINPKADGVAQEAFKKTL